MNYQTSNNMKSVKSINPFNPDSYRDLIQTVYDIAYAHEWEIKVERNVGKGSTFIIQLTVV